MAVTFISHGYDTLPGQGLSETVWEEMHPQIGTSMGVRNPGDWKVTAVSGADRTVAIAAGRGWDHGIIDKTVDNDTIQLDPVAGPAGTVRWDLIVCRRDPTPSAGVSKFEKISGGATPVIPGGRLSGPGIRDQPLALVPVIAGQTQPGTIIDLRTWSGDSGGLIAKDDLVLSFLNTTGTRVNINGKDWIRIPGANDLPEWVGTVTTQSAANVTTFGPGFEAVTTNGHRARVVRDGNMVHLVGAVRRLTGDFGNMLTVPAAFRPANSATTFVGSGVSSNGIAYELSLSNGVLSIVNGYATESDTGAFTIFPITASWPIV